MVNELTRKLIEQMIADEKLAHETALRGIEETHAAFIEFVRKEHDGLSMDDLVLPGHEDEPDGEE